MTTTNLVEPACAIGAAFLAMALLGTVLGVRWLPTELNAYVQKPPTPIAGPAAPRCSHCGWIESRRQLEGSGASMDEYTVRMSDGSSRVFQELRAVKWNLRERLMFLDGAPG